MDFTLNAYKNYIKAIKSSCSNIYRFDEYLLADNKPGSFCIIRHDVDRRPKKALDMARLENELGIKASYYFRTKSHVFLPEIIKQVSALGHEIGYHYECLSDMKGDIPQAVKEFEKKLAKMQKIAEIMTIAMHGSPLSRFNNLDLWRDEDQRKILRERFGIAGEVYLDVDYTDIFYITDTGRNWSPSRSNKRDRVNSKSNLNLKNGDDLLQFFKKAKSKKIVFQVHPERWSKSLTEHIFYASGDYAANMIKRIIA
ncbi:hypothetical protein ACFL2O_09605 [Thermodesulfobacteriota bacterium]